MELIIPFKEYYDAREKYRELKPKYKEVTRNFKRMQAVHAPYVAMEKYASVIRIPGADN